MEIKNTVSGGFGPHQGIVFFSLTAGVCVFVCLAFFIMYATLSRVWLVW